MKHLLLISLFWGTVFLGKSQLLIGFDYSECYADCSEDSLTYVVIEKGGTNTNIRFGSLAPCNGNFEGDALLNGNNLYLSFTTKPIINFKEDGTKIELVEIADCDCFFRFSYMIHGESQFDNQNVYANGQSIYDLSTVTSSIEEEIEVDLCVELTEDIVIEEIVFSDSSDGASDGIYTIVDSQPSFNGGMKGFNEYIKTNLNYPVEAKSKNIEGRVYVQFIVDIDGSISNVKALKGIGKGCDEEAVRLIESAPKFIPGQHNGKYVKVKMLLPVVFRLLE